MRSEQRRLMAVVVADIVGYSRLMSVDEADTFRRVKALQTALVTPAVDRNRGRVVKWTGDGFLAVFESALDAVRFSIEVQSGIAAKAAGSTGREPIEMRIGVNVGDVILVPGDVYGDTVNVAARLESLCPTGGIFVSRAIRDTVRGKFEVEFEEQGEIALKNIRDPVGVYSTRFEPIAWTEEPPPRRKVVRPAMVVGAGAALAAVAVAVMLIVRPDAPARPDVASRPEPAVKAGVGDVAKSGTEAGPNEIGKAAPSLRDALASAWSDFAPAAQPSTVARLAGGYEGAQRHKAQAASPEGFGWRATGRPSEENAESSALELCQVAFGRPCALLALNEAVRTRPPGGAWPLRDMPRASFAGEFDPDRIPGFSPAGRAREEVKSYAAAPIPKAAAFHALIGRLFVSSGARHQRAAEEQALAACADSPDRTDRDRPCFLYAVANRVVLPMRRTDPLTPLPLAEALSTYLAAAIPELTPAARDEKTRLYEQARSRKAQAFAPGTTITWFSSNGDAGENTEDRALEGCQVFAGRPCAIIAVDDVVRPLSNARAWQVRDMQRVRYGGGFDPEMIPTARPPLRRRGDVAGFKSASAPKAAAIHPTGRLFIVSGARDQREAEERALGDCNADPDRKGANGPCFLYAVGTKVVLPERRTEPVSQR